jgi:nucleotide-binding universal stress UspA family protein
MASAQVQGRAQEMRTVRLSFPRILVVIDGSERTGRILEFALGLAQEGPGAEVVLLGVVRAPPDGRLRGYGSFKRHEIHTRLKDVLRQRAVTAAARRLNQAGVTHLDRIEIGDPIETILRVAEQESCDLIVVGDAPAGVFRRWLPKATGLSVATVAGQIAQLASVAVVIVK